MPSVPTGLSGETTPPSVSTDQSRLLERISIVVFEALVPSPQNGHVPSRADNGVRSISCGPPVHTAVSVSGSSLENENRQVLAVKSTSTYRFLPGQFESYNRILGVVGVGYSIAYGNTACPPPSVYTPSV